MLPEAPNEFSRHQSPTAQDIPRTILKPSSAAPRPSEPPCSCREELSQADTYEAVRASRDAQEPASESRAGTSTATDLETRCNLEYPGDLDVPHNRNGTPFNDRLS